jgi:DNA-binding NarL/FixJ family response regulator
MSRTVRILLVEDSAIDAALVKHELDRAGMDTTIERVDSRDAFSTALRGFAPQVVLADHACADLDARAAMRMMQMLRPTASLIVVARALDEPAAIEALRDGAEDIILKDNLSRLAPAIVKARSVRTRLEKLSPRQLEVLRLVAEGHTTREIALRLELSVKTIETHRAQLMKRLGIHDLVGLVRYAVRLGLVPQALVADGPTEAAPN